MIEVVEAAADAQGREASSGRTGRGYEYVCVCRCVRGSHGTYISRQVSERGEESIYNEKCETLMHDTSMTWSKTEIV